MSQESQLASLAAEACTAPEPRRSEVIDQVVAIVAASGEGAALRPLLAAVGPQFTSTESELRNGATRLVARVLSRLSAVSDDALGHLTDFFCSRLQDYACASAVLDATSALVALLPPASARRAQICDALLDESDVRSLAQAERAAALRLTLELSGAASDEPGGAGGGEGLINGVPGARFVLGALRAFDGEKDPRNLLLYLQLVRGLCRRCEEVGADGFGEAVAEVFDSLSFYFPISFAPPADDENGITQAHLLTALLRTLRATPRFAPLAFPFFLQHLTTPRLDGPEGPAPDAEIDSDAQMQALQGLATLASAYGPQALAPHAEMVAHAMRAQLSQLLSLQEGGSGVAAATGAEFYARQAAITEALRSLTRTCLQDAPLDTSAVAMDDGRPADARPLLERVLTPVLGLCAAPRPQGPGAAIGGQLLRAVALVAPAAAALAVARCVPPLLQAVVQQGAVRAEQADALALLLALLRAALDASLDTPADTCAPLPLSAYIEWNVDRHVDTRDG